MSTSSAPTNLSSAGDEQRRDLDEDADDEGADDGAPDGAEAAEHDRGEHEQQDLEADLVVEALGEPEQRTGQAGQRRAADPDHEITRSTLMPVDAASAGLSATARVALPIRVYCSRRRSRPARRSPTHDDDQLLGRQQDRPDLPRLHGGVLRVVLASARRRSTGRRCAGRSTGRCSRSSSRSGRCRGVRSGRHRAASLSQPKRPPRPRRRRPRRR